MVKISNISNNQLLLPDGKIITFNDQQFEGINKIKKWLSERNKPFFTLTGPAGSGKTSILKKILNKFEGGVVVSAPTHKAVGVIKKMTNCRSATLHSLLGLRMDVHLENFNPNQPIFNPIALPKINDYNFCIVDEASMVNKDLFNLIKEKIENSKTKVLFVGDSCQIPPVGEAESAVFNEPSIEKHYLTKVERQQDTNPILFVADMVRNNINGINNNDFERKTEINENGEGVLFTTNKKQFRELMLENFKSDEFSKDVNFCRGIAWKNNTIMLSNKIIRTNIFGKESDIIEINDILMGYRTITNENQSQIIIQNSADYKVIEKSDIIENGYGILGYNVTLIEILDRGEYNYKNVFIVNANDHQNLHLYGQMHDFFKEIAFADKKQWKKYYEFRRNNILMKNIDKYQNNQPRPSKEIIVKDIDYGFFLTAHKVQGSTYKHVGIILSDLEDNWLLKERNQLFYTSLTRPVLTATILSNRIDY